MCLSLSTRPTIGMLYSWHCWHRIGRYYATISYGPSEPQKQFFFSKMKIGKRLQLKVDQPKELNDCVIE